MATVADTLYVVVGYKTDEASLKAVEERFKALAGFAKQIGKEAKGAGEAMRFFGKTSAKVLTQAQKATQQAVNATAAVEKTATRAARSTERVARSSQSSAEAARTVGTLGARGWMALGAAASAAATAVAAYATAGAVNAYKASSQEIVSLANATNTSVEAFSSMAYVARASGVEVDDLRDGFNDLSEKALEAYKALKEGKKDNEYLKTFQALDINLERFVKLKPDERFEQMADALNKIKDPGQRSATVMKLMSDEGTKFFSIFNRGTGEIQRLRKEAEDLGATLSATQAQDLRSYSAAMGALTVRFEVLRDRLAAEMIPILTDAMAEMAKALSPDDIKRAGDDIAATVKVIRPYVIGIAKALGGFARAIVTLTHDLGGLVNVFKLVALGFLIFKGPAMFSAAAGVIAFGKAIVGLTLSLGGVRVALGLITTQLKAMGLAAAATAGKMALLALPFLLLEDYATWGAGGDSIIGHIFGPKTQENINSVHNALLGIALVFAGILALVFGAPVAIGAALAATAAYAYSAVDDFKMFFTGVFGFIELGINALIKRIKDLIDMVTVDLPGALGDSLSGKLSFIGSLGRSTPSIAQDAALGTSTSTVSNNQDITVQIDARGAQNPQAIGAAASDGVAQAARQIRTQYDSGAR